jgi:hypothetical protein
LSQEIVVVDATPGFIVADAPEKGQVIVWWQLVGFSGSAGRISVLLFGGALMKLCLSIGQELHSQNRDAGDQENVYNAVLTQEDSKDEPD